MTDEQLGQIHSINRETGERDLLAQFSVDPETHTIELVTEQSPHFFVVPLGEQEEQG